MAALLIALATPLGFPCAAFAAPAALGILFGIGKTGGSGGKALCGNAYKGSRCGAGGPGTTRRCAGGGAGDGLGTMTIGGGGGGGAAGLIVGIAGGTISNLGLAVGETISSLGSLRHR